MPTYLQVDGGIVTGVIETPGTFRADDLPAGRVMVEVDPVIHPPREQLFGFVEGVLASERVVDLTDESKARVRVSHPVK